MNDTEYRELEAAFNLEPVTDMSAWVRSNTDIERERVSETHGTETYVTWLPMGSLTMPTRELVAECMCHHIRTIMSCRFHGLAVKEGLNGHIGTYGKVTVTFDKMN